MPYRLVGAQRFYGRREIKDLIAYLRLVQNPADEVSLGRVINVPPRGIGDKTLVALQLAAQKARCRAGEVLLDLGRRAKNRPIGADLRAATNLLADFGALLAGWHDHVDSMPLPDLFDRILEDTVYHEYINDGTEEGRSRWENVQELRRLAYEYEERGLSSFLENLALVSDQDTVPEDAEAPTLLTLHAAKGLEFPIVFIVGLDDGVLPHNRSLDDPEEMAEERRLFYVGLTRAKHRLYLVRAEQRSLYGSFQESIPSRFLEDIPEELIRPIRGAGEELVFPPAANGYPIGASHGPCALTPATPGKRCPDYRTALPACHARPPPLLGRRHGAGKPHPGWRRDRRRRLRKRWFQAPGCIAGQPGDPPLQKINNEVQKWPTGHF